MKIRNGFVSNSSSSSFIVRFDEKYPNTLAIAESMIKNRFEEWHEFKENDDDTHPTEIQIYKNIERLKKTDVINMPMFFRSTNYDTYIMAITDKYAYVDTCNNTNWDVKNISIHKVPDDLIESFPNVDRFGELNLDIVYDNEYYILETGLIAKAPAEYDTCKKCYDSYWYIDGVKYCIKCDWNKISRGLKLNKVKNLIANSKN